MPSLITWFSGGGGNTASVTTTATSGLGSAFAYINQTSTTTSGLYSAQQNTASATHWAGLGSTTSTAGTIFWTDTSQGQWYAQEEMVTPAQYIALAHRRVEYTEEQRALMAQEAAQAQARHLQRVAEHVAEQLARDEQRMAARARSRELLLQHLTREQRRTFEENNWFIVQGGHSKKTYRIRTTSYTGNIDELDRSNERTTHRLCGHLRGAYALYDHHVAQKISLEYDEQAFLALCNRHAA